MLHCFKIWLLKKKYCDVDAASIEEKWKDKQMLATKWSSSILNLISPWSFYSNKGELMLLLKLSHWWFYSLFQWKRQSGSLVWLCSESSGDKSTNWDDVHEN